MPLSNDDLHRIAVIMSDSRVRTALIVGNFDLAAKLLDTAPNSEITLTTEEYAETTPIKTRYDLKDPVSVFKGDVPKVLTKRYAHDSSPMFTY